MRNDGSAIDPETAILAAEAAGFDASDLRRQQQRSKESSSEVGDLLARIEKLEQQLGGGSANPEQSQEPTDEQQMGQAILKGIQAARTPWYSYTGTGDAV
jgi:hypothetical protein